MLVMNNCTAEAGSPQHFFLLPLAWVRHGGHLRGTLLRQAMDAPSLSARAYSKIFKVARTIADPEGREQIRPHHVSEAISYRALE